MPRFVEVTRNGQILEVKLNKPKVNAIDHVMSREMGEAFALLRDDPELRVAILTGTGEKFFCPGWDLKAAAEGEAPDSDYGVGGFGGLQELPGLNKPVICAVNGLAFGGGFEIMISCDIIIAADDASFRDMTVEFGVNGVEWFNHPWEFGIRKVVFSSSAGIFGELKTLPIAEGHPVEPDSPYGASKLAAEKLCLAYARLYAPSRLIR